MAVHDEVLKAAQERCRQTGSTEFELSDIVAALPHLNEGSVRTHVTSRCCINAPKHHAHRWGYFRRVSRGVYELVSKYRIHITARRSAELSVRQHLHVTVTRSDGKYTAECLELPVITEALDLNQLVQNLREALTLHLADENLADL